MNNTHKRCSRQDRRAREGDKTHETHRTRLGGGPCPLYGARRSTSPLAVATDQMDRALPARRIHGHAGPAGQPQTRGTAGPAGHRGEQGGGRRQRGHGLRRETAGGRLHHRDGQYRPHLDQPRLVSRPALSAAARPGAGDNADERAQSPRGESRAAGTVGAGADRVRKEGAGADGLRHAGRGHLTAPGRRAVRIVGGPAPDTRAVPGQRAGSERHGGRARADDVRQHAVGAAAREGRQAAGARDHQRGAVAAIARCADDGRGRPAGL
ncbi:hypothetical protein D9M68_698880 [compost metagenome]